MFKHLYQNPPAAIAFAEGSKVSDEDLKAALIHFEKFYEEIFIELANYGEIRELYVVDNLGDHLIGNVYVRYNDEISASKAFNALAGKYYQSRLVEEEYSPITKIIDGKCKKFSEGTCQRGAFCNFLHFKEVNKALIKSLRDEMYENHPEYKKIRIITNNKNKQRNHEHTSSDSSLDRYDNITRKRIIRRWNADYRIDKGLQARKKKTAQAKIDLAILQQKLRGIKKFDEDEKINNNRRLKNFEKYDDSDETISNNN